LEHPRDPEYLDMVANQIMKEQQQTYGNNTNSSNLNYSQSNVSFGKDTKPNDFKKSLNYVKSLENLA